MNVKIKEEWAGYELHPVEDYIQIYAKKLGANKDFAFFLGRWMSVLVDRKLIDIDEFRYIVGDEEHNLSFTQDDY